jgi:hypothetical protein
VVGTAVTSTDVVEMAGVASDPQDVLAIASTAAPTPGAHGPLPDFFRYTPESSTKTIPEAEDGLQSHSGVSGIAGQLSLRATDLAGIGPRRYAPSGYTPRLRTTTPEEP